MRKSLMIFLCLIGSLAAQVLPSPADVTQNFYDNSGNLQYICYANQLQQSQSASKVQVSDSSLTSIAVSSNTATATTLAAHGAWVGMRITVSGSATTALNGTYTVLTVPSTTAYTFTTSGVGNATYNDATLVISTSNPILTAALWAIKIFTYNGTSQNTGSYWANSTQNRSLACTSRTSY